MNVVGGAAEDSIHRAMFLPLPKKGIVALAAGLLLV